MAMPQAFNPSDSRVRAAVIGLGQAGSRFDEEPGRKAIWSHVGAYLERADRLALVGAVEVAPPNAAAFRARCPNVPVYADVEKLIAEQRPHIISICTPASNHAEILFKLLDAPDLRLIWCEKPLAAGLDEARRIVEACRQRNIKLMVSYNRHWLPIWRRTGDFIREGALGTVRTLRVAFPNRLLSIGSHAVDLALMLGGPVASVVAQPLPDLEEIWKSGASPPSPRCCCIAPA
jgi:predicted dehydrogenase